MNYQLPELHFNYNDLEPYIDHESLRYCHKEVHAEYILKLNSLLRACPLNVRAMTLEDIIYDIRVVPAHLRQEIRNYGGAHLNHSLYWQILTPPNDNISDCDIIPIIKAGFGNFEFFKNQFTQVALDRFGSGWAWLCLDFDGKLETVRTPNQDSPVMLGYLPILGANLWEHAYFNQYRSDRTAYVDAFWKIVNWRKVSQLHTLYLEALSHMIN